MTGKRRSARRCICGCGRQRGCERHHVVYQQELKRHVPRSPEGPPDIVRELALLRDDRNLVWVGPKCHAAHHSRVRPLLVRMLPDSVFEFARELLGGPAAYEYLARRYAGRDPRHDALLEEAVAA